MELHELTLAELQQKIKKKEVSISEITEANLKRIEALNPQLGAYITKKKPGTFRKKS